MFRRYSYQVAGVVAAGMILGLIAGSLLGQPVLLSFVTSESMSPTIQEGDGFVAIPKFLAGDIDEGDVIVFDAVELEGGGLTTHRVVEETRDGYITRGDANPFTDQDSDEPPVTEDRIVAVAWQPGGQVVTIPAVGSVILDGRAMVAGVTGAVTSALGFESAGDSQRPRSVLLLLGLVLFVAAAVSFLGDNSGRDWSRSRNGDEEIKTHHVAIILVAVVLVPANAAMLLPSATQTVDVRAVAAEAGAEPGEQVDLELSASNDGFVTMLFLLDSPPEVTLADRRLEIPGGASAATTMTAPVPPPDEPGTVRITQHRYIVILPPSMLVGLHSIHPFAALAAINGVLIFGVVALVVGLAGGRRRRARNTG